jgi:fumarate reductase flavoprotein subunit
MKKIMTVLLVLAVLGIGLGAIACGTSSALDSGAKFTPPPAPPPAVQSRDVSLKPGTYTEEVKGMFLGNKIAVTLESNRISKIEFVQNNETPGISEQAIALVAPAIIKYQSTAVDVVTGATMTSGAIIQAVEKAVTDAGGSPAAFRVPVAYHYEDKILSRKAITDANGTTRGSVATPRNWDETYDIVVIGGGYAGLAAAYAAADNGAKTVVIEKMPMLGGNSQINGGQYAAYTSSVAADYYKRNNAPPDTAEQHYKDTMAGGDYLSRPDMVTNMVYAGPVFFDLLLKNGLDLRPSIVRAGGHYGYRTYATTNSQGDKIVDVQKKMIADKGVKVELNSKVVRIYREGPQSGRVVGVAVVTVNGLKYIKANKGVINASGGFGANVPMRSAQLPALTSDYPTTNHVGATGEGILYSEEIGAQTMQMDQIQLYPFANPNTGVLDVWAVIPFSGPSAGIVYVDYKGERYVNEGERRDVNARAAQNSGGFPCFTILNQEIVDKAKFTTQEDIDSGMANGRVFKADTLEDLAKQLNAASFRSPSGTPGNVKIAPGTLTRTIQTHNGYVQNGADPAFGKRIDKGIMFQMTSGPYYAVPQWPSVHHTMGGLITTNKLEVVDFYGNVIPGFFAAGEVTGGVHGTNRLGSNADADSCGNGYIAGYFAATGKLPDFLDGKKF